MYIQETQDKSLVELKVDYGHIMTGLRNTSVKDLLSA